MGYAVIAEPIFLRGGVMTGRTRRTGRSEEMCKSKFGRPDVGSPELLIIITKVRNINRIYVADLFQAESFFDGVDVVEFFPSEEFHFDVDALGAVVTRCEVLDNGFGFATHVAVSGGFFVDGSTKF